MLNAALVSLLVLATPGAQKAKPAHNTICPGCGGAVTAKSPTAIVRDQTYRFCCSDCGAMVQKNPDKYLEKDGTPKNSKR